MIQKLFFATLLSVWMVATTISPSIADTAHDSNTLHKVGNSIQYVFRKAGVNVSKSVHKVTSRDAVNKAGSAVQYTTRKDAQNLSIDAHNVEGKKSVVHQDNGEDKIIPPLPHRSRKHLFQ